MMENTVSLETLKVENYSMESGLTPVNRRTVDKMFHYIHSFPLDEYDVELIRKDIIGMAMEGEQRNEPLHMMIGKKPRDFCNDLIYAIAGFTVPRGRAFLFAAGWFYRIMGGLYYLFAGWSILSLLLGWLMNRGTKDAIPLDVYKRQCQEHPSCLFRTPGYTPPVYSRHGLISRPGSSRSPVS